MTDAAAPKLDPTQLEELREALVARRAEFEARLRAEGAELDEVRGARAESADDEHDPEGSTLSADWSRIAGLQQATLDGLAAVDRAIARMNDGSYGRCLRCGTPIAAGRLEARPEAERCITCAAIR